MVKINKKYNYKKIFIIVFIIIFIFILYCIFTKYSFIELFYNDDNNNGTSSTIATGTTVPTFENNTIIKQESAVFLSHNMLGDNITNIGAVNFLTNYYNTIYFICKDVYVENVNLLFQKKIINKNIVLVQISSNNEPEDCKNVINNFMKNNLIDIFVSGYLHTSHLKSRISHPNLLQYVQNDNGYTIEWSHIHDFYYDIGLDLSIYYNYFNIDSSKESKEYFENIKTYNIILLHTKSSQRELSLSHIIDKYINVPDIIIICSNKNVYENTHNKYELANKYINLLIPYYIDIIYNAFEIHVIDSCLSCIVHPLNVTKKLKAQTVNIYNRDDNI
jgi:hypothetical protein